MTRDDLLRRADWRFLLPSDPPRRVACLTDGEVAEAARAIAQPVTRDAAEPADLAVVADAGAQTLAAAFRALPPGGVCYGEWRGLRVGPRGVRRRLQCAGFTDVSLYWPWPGSARRSPRWWLPLETRAPLARFLAGRADAQTSLRRLAVLVWDVALKAHLLRPICAVARKPGDGTPAGLLPAVRDRWEAAGLGPAPEQVSLVLFSPGASPLNKVLGFALADRRSRPALVLKLGRVPAAERALHDEAATLQALAGAVPGVPSVLFLTGDGPTVLAESFLDGRRLTALLDDRRYPALARKVTHWLCDLASARPSPGGWSDLDDLAATASSLVEPSELEVLRTRLRSLAGLPVVPEQRDCSPWNILLTEDDELVVLDWESARLDGVPYLDLAYFLAHSAFLLDGALDSPRLAGSYRASLDERTPVGAVTAACTRIYLARLGIDAGLVPALRALTWLVHLDAAHRRLGAAGAARTAFPTLLREELRSG